MARLCSTAVALAVICLAAAAPASARRACPSTHVVVRSDSGVVFTRVAKDISRTKLYYGCLHAVRKIYRLTQVGDYGLNNVHRTTIRLAGRYVAYEQDWGSGAGGPLNRISVRDLRTGVVIHQAEVSRRGSDLGDNATDVALKRTGSVAWIAKTYDQQADRATAEVRAMTPATHRRTRSPLIDAPLLFDDGPEIGLASLRITADRRSVAWRHGSETRSAKLP
jgi:hypothetical protein